MSKPAPGALCIGLGAFWLLVVSANRPAVVLTLVLVVMLFWLFRRKGD